MPDHYGYPRALTDLSEGPGGERPDLTPEETARELLRIASTAGSLSTEEEVVIHLPTGTVPGYTDPSERAMQVTGPDGEVGLRFPIRGSEYRHGMGKQ